MHRRTQARNINPLIVGHVLKSFEAQADVGTILFCDYIFKFIHCVNFYFWYLKRKVSNISPLIVGLAFDKFLCTDGRRHAALALSFSEY